jgi:hypothetical protein
MGRYTGTRTHTTRMRALRRIERARRQQDHHSAIRWELLYEAFCYRHTNRLSLRQRSVYNASGIVRI